MKIVVLGGSGLIGSKVVQMLAKQGHDVFAASPNTGVDATTGRGLAEALAGANVVVDVSNSPSFEDGPVLAFFESSGRNIARTEAEAGVRHHVALSVVGTDRLQESGYFRAKLVQEGLIKASGIPYTIVRATQFYEFLGAIAAGSTVDGRARLCDGAFQPIAAEDVSAIVADVALRPPLNGTMEIAGPERMTMSAYMARYFRAIGDPREVVRDPDAGYFGARLDDHTLVPGDRPRLGAITLEEWVKRAPDPKMQHAPKR